MSTCPPLFPSLQRVEGDIKQISVSSLTLVHPLLGESIHRHSTVYSRHLYSSPTLVQLSTVHKWGILWVLPCYRVVTIVLQEFYKTVTTLLPGLYWTVGRAFGYRSLFYILLILSPHSPPVYFWRVASFILLYRSVSLVLKECYWWVKIVFYWRVIAVWGRVKIVL